MKLNNTGGASCAVGAKASLVLICAVDLVISSIASSTSGNPSPLKTNCVVSNATIDTITATNCTLTNGFYDPSDLTGTSATGSTIMNSNVTFSNVTSSTIINSNINNAVITGSTIINSTFSNATVTGANITNGAISAGTITVGNFTYNASSNATANLSSVIPVPPVINSISFNGATVTRGAVVQYFNNTVDANVGGPLNDSLTFYWSWSDGQNSTVANPSMIFSTAGAYTVNVTATDKFGLSAFCNCSCYTIHVPVYC